MALRPLTLAIALAALAGYLAGARRRRSKQSQTPVAPAPALQTWEGEGGAVPVGGSQTAASRVQRGDVPTLHVELPSHTEPLPRGLP
jgi:hypothetical protein